MHSRLSRTARRAGALAAIEHCLRDGPPPCNPHRPGSASAIWFDFGVEQACRFAFPMQEPRR